MGNFSCLSADSTGKPSLGPALSKRTRMPGACVFVHFLVAVLKKNEKKLMKLVLIIYFYLTSCIQNILISPYNQYNIIVNEIVSIFFSKSLKSGMYFTLAAHLSWD